MAAIAFRKIFHTISTEGIGHALLLAAGFAQHLDIRGLACDPKLTEFEPCPARYLSMHKANPGKIIQVPIFTRHQKAGRHHGWRCPRRRTVHVDIARLVGPVKVCLELEQVRVQ